MNTKVTRLLRAVLVFASCIATTMGNAQTSGARGPSDFFGLLRVRDLTPFGFMRLDMRPSPTTFAKSDGATVETDFGYQNTWALSDDVGQYLHSRPRGPLTDADVAAIRAMPGEHYLIDGEIGLFDVAINYPVTDRLGVYGMLSVGTYSGGFLDGVVEDFHRTFGLGGAGRSAVTRNQINILLDLKGAQSTDLNWSARSGLLDPVAGARYALVDRPDFNLVADGAVKVPVSQDRTFATGRADVGVQLTAQRFAGNHAYYASGSIVQYSGNPPPFTDSSMIVPTGTIGYEYRWLRAGTNLIAQLVVSRSTFTSKETDLSELRCDKYQMSIGMRRRFANGYWTLAVTENLRNFDNTPDIGFQLGAAYRL